ncbi:MAG: hypothetical protein U1E73_06325 [Planctomycetota bacterium]
MFGTVAALVLGALLLVSLVAGPNEPDIAPTVRPEADAALPAAMVATGTADALPAGAEPPGREVVPAEAAVHRERTVRVRVCREFGGDAIAPFPPATAVVDTPDWRLVLDACDPAVFTVPPEARELRFFSSLYEDVRRALPAAGADGVVDLGTVVLHTDAHIVLRLWHPPAGMPRDLVATTGFGGTLVLGEAAVQWRGDCGEARLPASTDFAVGTPAGDFVINLPDSAARRLQGLEHGECRTIDVDLGALQPFTLRLEGVPTELRAHLAVRWYCGCMRPRRIVFDADGAVTMLGVPRDRPGESGRLWIDTAPDGHVGLRSARGELQLHLTPGSTTYVHPDAPLVGIAMRVGEELAAFRLGVDRLAVAEPARPMHVMALDEFTRVHLLRVRRDGARDLLVAPGDLQADGAMRWVHPEAVPANGTLIVRPVVPTHEAHGFAVLAHRLDGDTGDGGVPWRGWRFATADLPAGRWCVDLWYFGCRVGAVADDVVLARGGTVELAVELPAFSPWAGVVDNWAELPPDQRPTEVVFGTQRETPTDTGAFAITCADGAAPRGGVTMRYDNGQRFDCARIDCDPVRQVLRVRAPVLHVVELRDARGRVPERCLAGVGDATTPFELRTGACYLRDGERVRGAWLVNGPDWDGSTQVAAWFDRGPVDAAAAIATHVDARWITVDVRRPVRSFAVRVLGPAGCPPVLVAEQGEAARVRVLVVAGTREIEVELDGEVQRFAVPAQGLVVD